MRWLTFASRVQLIKSVFMTMYGFWARMFTILKALVRQVEKHMTMFLSYGDLICSRKVKVSWKEVRKTQDEGD